MIFEDKFTEEEIREELIRVVAANSDNGISEKELVDTVMENLTRKHLEIDLDNMVKRGLLKVSKKGGYSVTAKGKRWYNKK